LIDYLIFYDLLVTIAGEELHNSGLFMALLAKRGIFIMPHLL
jgi:hypothetical protein